ncbi:MAG: GGDEF domain-containing protein [Clostridia bacterium]|nr:GGDEF domain-containing protein [Clostridia bacterium]
MKFDLFGFIKKHNSESIGENVRKNRYIYAIILATISIFEIVMIIRGSLIFDFKKLKHLLYFCSYILLLTASISTAIILNIKKLYMNSKVMSITIHIYVGILYAWSTLVSYLDLAAGHTPIVYLTIVIVVAGVTMVNLYFYCITTIVTFAGLIVACYVNHFEYLESTGLLLNLLVLVVMAILMNARLFIVTNTETDQRKMLEILSKTDVLTGLGNETAYFEYVDKINGRIEKENYHDFAVVLMDLNGLKATNDKYGHRYGCHLVVESGHRLPILFTTSKLFHIGGDEFVGIVEGDNFKKLESLIKRFDEDFTHTRIAYEGHDLLLSLARGYSVCQGGEHYRNVFQRADEMMYENKAIIKEKYHIESRKS